VAHLSLEKGDRQTDGRTYQGPRAWRMKGRAARNVIRRWDVSRSLKERPEVEEKELTHPIKEEKGGESSREKVGREKTSLL